MEFEWHSPYSRELEIAGETWKKCQWVRENKLRKKRLSKNGYNLYAICFQAVNQARSGLFFVKLDLNKHLNMKQDANGSKTSFLNLYSFKNSIHCIYSSLLAQSVPKWQIPFTIHCSVLTGWYFNFSIWAIVENYKNVESGDQVPILIRQQVEVQHDCSQNW